MSLTLNQETYAKLIEEDIDWLLKQPCSLKRDHIIAVLKESVAAFYPPENYIPPGHRGDRA